jgi:hypothetical protein
MAQTFTNNAGTVFAGVGRDYPMQMGIGRIGELADISNSTIIGGNNETAARILFGIPLIRNGSGVLPNSVTPAVAASTIFGFSVLTDVHEVSHRQAATPYQEGIEPNDAVNVLKVGALYIDCWESLAPGNALRYFKSGVNAGRWGKTASTGNSLNFSAGGWEIERPAAAGGLAIVRFNTPAALVVTAD